MTTQATAARILYHVHRIETAHEALREIVDRNRAAQILIDIADDDRYCIGEICDDDLGGSPDEHDLAAAAATEQAEPLAAPAVPADAAANADGAESIPMPTVGPARIRIDADELKEQFALGECATVDEAIEMALAQYPAPAVAEALGVSVKLIYDARNGHPGRKLINLVLPLLPKRDGEED